MSAFTDATDAIFADNEIGKDALWYVGGSGPGLPVRVIRSKMDDTIGFGASLAIVGATIIEVRSSQVEAPAKGDKVEIVSSGVVEQVIAEPIREDDELYLWSCEVKEI